MNRESLAIITQNARMREVIEKVDKTVNSDASVLLVGETGVGKEIFAEYIHRTSNRSGNPFVKISLSAMPAELLESELFGHVKGAFTNAMYEKKGLFEIADSGSIFLDDIDDVPLQIQSKLLRALESREILPVGATSPVPIDVRLISASKVNLKELVKKNIFRADLFYRINVVPIYIPPLRERKDDIPPLIEYFLKQFAPEKNLKISPECLKLLLDYDWPGNVRELRNLIQRLTLFAKDVITPLDLPPELRKNAPLEYLLKSCDKCFINGGLKLTDVVSCLEKNLIEKALAKSKGNQSEASRYLGLSLSTFRDKMRKYKIERQSF